MSSKKRLYLLSLFLFTMMFVLILFLISVFATSLTKASDVESDEATIQKLSGEEQELIRWYFLKTLSVESEMKSQLDIVKTSIDNDNRESLADRFNEAYQLEVLNQWILEEITTDNLKLQPLKDHLIEQVTLYLEILEMDETDIEQQEEIKNLINRFNANNGGRDSAIKLILENLGLGPDFANGNFIELNN